MPPGLGSEPIANRDRAHQVRGSVETDVADDRALFDHDDLVQTVRTDLLPAVDGTHERLGRDQGPLDRVSTRPGQFRLRPPVEQLPRLFNPNLVQAQPLSLDLIAHHDHRDPPPSRRAHTDRRSRWPGSPEPGILPLAWPW